MSDQGQQGTVMQPGQADLRDGACAPTDDEARVAGWSLSVLGAIVAFVGFVLIYVRSRLPEDGPSKKPAPENHA